MGLDLISKVSLNGKGYSNTFIHLTIQEPHQCGTLNKLQTISIAKNKNENVNKCS